MDKCECGGELFPMDTEDHDCNCGQTYCGECDAEYSKEGEKLSGGLSERLLLRGRSRL
jgi:hypothetical protein